MRRDFRLYGSGCNGWNELAKLTKNDICDFKECARDVYKRMVLLVMLKIAAVKYLEPLPYLYFSDFTVPSNIPLYSDATGHVLVLCDFTVLSNFSKIIYYVSVVLVLGDFTVLSNTSFW